jgi:hypothetical protein
MPRRCRVRAVVPRAVLIDIRKLRSSMFVRTNTVSSFSISKEEDEMILIACASCTFHAEDFQLSVPFHIHGRNNSNPAQHLPEHQTQTPFHSQPFPKK